MFQQVSLQAPDVQSLTSPHMPRILDSSISASPTLMSTHISTPEDIIAIAASQGKVRVAGDG